MKIELNIKDRLAIINMLPSTGKLTYLVEVLDLIKLIKFTQEENDKYSIKSDGNRIIWNIELDSNKEFDLNIEQINIIKDQIKKLDNE